MKVTASPDTIRRQGRVNPPLLSPSPPPVSRGAHYDTDTPTAYSIHTYMPKVLPIALIVLSLPQLPTTEPETGLSTGANTTGRYHGQNHTIQGTPDRCHDLESLFYKIFHFTCSSVLIGPYQDDVIITISLFKKLSAYSLVDRVKFGYVSY